MWERFREHVRAEFGCLDGYLGREAEAAMKAYADADGYAGVEERVDQLIRAAGRTPGEASKEKTSDLSNEETTRVTARVDELVKDEFRSVAKKGDDTFGVTFARALRTYLEGGRAARFERKLDRVLDDATAVLEEMNSDQGGEGDLSAVERRTITICNRLPEQFTDEEFTQEIVDVAGSSKPTIEKYRERVVDRLNVEPHPNAPRTVWISEEYAADLAPEGTPRVCRQPVELLDREERIQRIQLAVGRRAAKRNHSRIRVSSSNVREDVLEHEVSKSSVLDLMETAALTEGFRLDRNGTTVSLAVDLKTVRNADPDLFETVIEYRDGDAGDLLSDTTETTVGDYTDGGAGVSPKSVSDRMNTLSEATTDGGGPPSER